LSRELKNKAIKFTETKEIKPSYLNTHEEFLGAHSLKNLLT
jgi:hypothetical protein